MRDPKNLNPFQPLTGSAAHAALLAATRIINAIFIFLLLSGTASAQFTITDVVNAGSRIASAASSGGIPQGAVFIASGKGIGPDQIQQATFPLPTTDGLGGVTIQIASNGAVIDAIMVYVAPNEVAAILPSATPLGPATITVNNNGVSASKDIKVIPSAFGIFVEIGTGGVGTAVAFNVNGDGTFTQNSIGASVQPEQDILINGTGLGAIASDETQPGVTDVPAATPLVYVGSKPATVVSAGRGYCCDGLDPSFRVPPGIAAWDVIRITIPDGIVGCFIPVVVVNGTYVSNLVTISIDPGGAACPAPLYTIPDALAQQLAGQTGIALGSVTLGRSTVINTNTAGAAITSVRDTGSATFVKYPNAPGSLFTQSADFPNYVCQVNRFPTADGGLTRDGQPVPIVPLQGVSMDAGAAITVKGPAGSRVINRQTLGALVDYRAPSDFGNGAAGNYYDPGHYTATGPGGKDAGPFTADIDVPVTPFVLTGFPPVTAPVDRTQDLTFTWTGGVPNTQVTIVGASGTGAFLCAAPVEDGQFVVPAWVLLSVPASVPTAPPGSIDVQNAVQAPFTVTGGLDITHLEYFKAYDLFVRFK